jgi:glutamate-1-semialdehyde 2,1-aminomutase
MLVEPIAGNMGCIPPVEGYLAGLRSLCDEFGALLVFDEVMTGFRVAYGGAQELHEVKPDLTCLGKIIGGGLPCAAYGGRLELMKQVAPEGPVYQAGTLSGNPLAMAAGVATLTELQREGVYEKLDASTARLATGLRSAAANAGIPVHVSQVGSMICCFFTDASEVRDYEGATACDTEQFALFFRSMLDNGVMLPPSQFETWFVSAEHDEETVDKTIDAAKTAFNLVAEARAAAEG